MYRVWVTSKIQKHFSLGLALDPGQLIAWLSLDLERQDWEKKGRSWKISWSLKPFGLYKIVTLLSPTCFTFLMKVYEEVHTVEFKLDIKISLFTTIDIEILFFVGFFNSAILFSNEFLLQLRVWQTQNKNLCNISTCSWVISIRWIFIFNSVLTVYRLF